MNISKPQLERALAHWETLYRQGLTLSAEETAQLPIEQVARESANWLWEYLSRGV